MLGGPKRSVPPDFGSERQDDRLGGLAFSRARAASGHRRARYLSLPLSGRDAVLFS